MIRANKLKARIVERDKTIPEVARAAGISPSSFYRKLKTGEFTIGEAQKIAEVLSLSLSDINDIFFNGDAA